MSRIEEALRLMVPIDSRRRAARPGDDADPSIEQFTREGIVTAPSGGLDDTCAELVVALRAVRSRRMLKSLAFTSAVPGDGTTSVVRSVARVLGDQGTSVLAVDANRRAPQLHEAFGIRNDRGLADWLRGDVQRPPAVAVTSTINVMTSGSGGPRPRLDRSSLQSLFDACGDDYDWILLDLPSIAASRDETLPLIRVPDGVVLVVGGRAPFRAVQEALAHCDRGRVVGTVLTHLALSGRALG